MSAEIHVNDLDTQILITLYDNGVLLNFSGATTKKIIFRKPNCTSVIVNGDFYTDGTDGILSYITPDNFWDLQGNWEIQARITFTTGRYSSDTAIFEVFSNLDD